jgi:mycothiol synthase
VVEGHALDLRPLTAEHRDPVLELLTARDEADFGVPDFTRQIILDLWRAGDGEAVVATNAGEVSGYAAVHNSGTVAFVHPRREGIGIGSALLAWAEARTRELSGCNRQWVPERNKTGQRLLVEAGYQQVRSVAQMARSLDGAAEAPPPPAGIELQPPDVTRDAEALHAADAAAFSNNPDYEPESLGTFQAKHLASPPLEPSLSRVAWRDDTVAGFILCRRAGREVGHVNLLAVVEPERRRGLGTGLLLGAFAAFSAAGLREAHLDVASDNLRARRVYDRAGMVPRHRLIVFEKPA